MDLKYTKNGFTLAEVLITLGIIGVVAALTLPTLISNYKDRQTIDQLKKAYSTIAQAYEKATYDEGTPDNWGLTEGNNNTAAKQNGIIIIDMLSHYIKQLKICEEDTGCWPNNVYYKQLQGSNGAIVDAAQTYGKAIINDGMLMYVWSRNMATCNGTRGNTKELNDAVCGTITIDVNGFKRPNKFGVDTFSFIISKYGIYPQGRVEDTVSSFNLLCGSRDGDPSHASNGLACTAWALENENLDYLHCSGLSWGGKTSCKQ